MGWGNRFPCYGYADMVAAQHRLVTEGLGLRRLRLVMGTSMGGQQSFATAGLNPDVTALVVNVPAGFDVNGEKAGRKTGYPGWPSEDAAIMRAGQYFDPVNFASKIKAKSVVAFGMIDTTSPPAE